MENSQHSEAPIIGRDIPWETIEGEFCSIKHFTPIATIESGKIKNVSKLLPYALLRVECPKVFQGEASIPVVHKQDFRNLWEAFKEIDINTQIMEIVVVYAPLKRRKLTKLFSGILPSLVIQVYPKGSLEKLCEFLHGGKLDEGMSVEECFNSLKPIAEWDARPENLK